MTLLALMLAAQFPLNPTVPLTRMPDGGWSQRLWIDSSSLVCTGGGGGGSAPSVSCAPDQPLTWDGVSWSCLSKVRAAYMADSGIVSQTAFSADASYSAQLASAFDHDPVACSAGTFATDQTSGGVLSCSAVDATTVTNLSSVKVGSSFMADAAVTSQTATALAADPADCSANQYATAINASGTLTCSQPGFSNLSGSASVAQGGTGVSSAAANTVVVGTGVNTTANSTLPSCSTGATDKLLYNSATQTFTCGTDQTSGGGSGYATIQEEGAGLTARTTVNFVGANITCVDNSGAAKTDCTVTGAPANATYITQTADGTLTNEQALGALATGILKNTTTTGVLSIAASGTDYGPPTSGNGTGLVLSTTGTGAHTAYAGTSCTNQFPRSLNASGAATCASVASADLAITATSCTNQFVSAVSTTGVGTCTTDTLASAQHANQGTTTTVLHGNAAGNPAWSAVSLTADVTGTLGNGNGGTGLATFAVDSALTSTSANTWAANALPSCSNATTSKLLYDTTTHAFSCGTDQTSAGGGYATVQDEASSLTQRATINFTGAGVTCVDNAGSTRTDCTISGGSGSPATGEGQLQYNSGGSFTSAGYARVDGGYLHLVNAPEPGAIADDGGVLLFSEPRARKSMMAWKGTSGHDQYAQTSIWGDGVYFTKFSGASGAKSDFGWATTAVGTAAAATYASTNLSTSIARAPYTTGTTASTPVEMRSGQLQFWRGNAADLGGFFCSGRWTNPTHNASSDKMFVGLQNSVAAMAGTAVPSATLNAVYCGYDAAASGLSLCGNDGTGTATCTACNTTDFPVNSTTAVFECDIHAKSNGSGINLELRRLDTSVTPCQSSITTAGDMPANTSFLGFRIWGSNGTTAANFGLSFISLYCETDHG